MPYRITPGDQTYQFYIINLLDNSGIYLTAVPESVSDNVQAQWDTVDIPGRTATYYGYTGTPSPDISFDITIHDDYCPSGIVKTINFFKSLAYPGFEDRIVPPNCKVVLGSSIKFLAVCQSVGVNWKLPFRDGYYVSADVNFSFKQVINVAPSYTEVRDGRIL